MKSNTIWWYATALLMVNLFFFSSCRKENVKPAPPVIEVVHLGVYDAESDGIFYLGEEGHFEVNITAPG
ncbi:MAG: hypothetical protein H3C48_18430, partial [Chitinophagaceae bacterium]|nr:hypothetical protein [Chitinophagaceae bacterium]